MPPGSGAPRRHERLRTQHLMSPGATFDRVYAGLKERLMSGAFAPGEHLEPVALGEQLHSSITPVRDALHRLVGERFVEAPRNDGFRAPVVSELGLRRLYGWQADLARLAVARARPLAAPPDAEGGEAPGSAAATLLILARASGDLELMTALTNACERLAPIALLEALHIADLDAEHDSFRAALDRLDARALRAAINAYQRRRDRAVPRIVAALQRAF